MPESVEEQALIEQAAEAMCDASPNGMRWVKLSESARGIYRNRIRAMQRQGFIATPGQQTELDDVRQALMDLQARLRGIRSAARAGEALGQVAYQRYSTQVQARSVSGDPLPPWAELRRGKPNVANAWVWAAAAVADVVLRGAHNGAHAAAEAAEDDPTEAAAREREERAQAEARPHAGDPAHPFPYISEMAEARPHGQPAQLCANCKQRPPKYPGADDPIGGNYCDPCVDRCHESTEFDHVCAICRAPEPPAEPLRAREV